MNNPLDDIRNSMRAAQVFGSGQYIEHGQHQLELVAHKYQRTMIDGAAKESIIFEFKVISSTNPTHEIGSTRSYVENLKNKGWLGRVKMCLLAVTGADPDHFTPEQNEIMVECYALMRDDAYRASKGLPENFLAGKRVSCEGMPGKSQSGVSITNKKWKPAPAAE